MGSIILDCDLMRFPNSGLYQYCLNLGLHVNEILAEQQQSKMQFYVPRNARDSFGNGNKVIVEHKYHRFFKPFLLDCKVWHAPFQVGRIIPQRNKSIRVVLTIHDLNVLHEEKPIKEQRNSIAKTQQLIDRSDAIVCISEFCKSDVLKHCDVSKKQVEVIYNGSNKLYEPILHKQSYLPVRPFLFAMGYVNRKKNFHTLLSLLEANPDLELVIAGRLDEPDYIRFIDLQAKQKGVTDRLHVLGPVSETDKAWYLKHCHAYVHPSLAEGFGSTAVEAMCFGKPIFLSHLTSLPEIGGDVAFYFKDFKSSHMNEVFRNGMEEFNRNGLMQKVINRSKQFQWRKTASEYIRLYQSLY